MIYVMSDIHGQYKAFIKMLKNIEFKEDDKVYILGDIFDKGPDSFKLFEHIKNSNNIYHILGNHDDMFFNTFFNKSILIRHMYRIMWSLKCNAGKNTYNRFLLIDNKEEYFNYFKNIETHAEVNINNQRYLLVHAGVSQYFIKNGKIRKPFDLWIRKSFIRNIKNNKLDFTIVFGHTPVKRILKYDKFNETITNRCNQYKIFHFENAIGIDCGAGNNNFLACLCLDNMKEFYIKIDKEEEK